MYIYGGCGAAWNPEFMHIYGGWANVYILTVGAVRPGTPNACIFRVGAGMYAYLLGVRMARNT